MSIEYSITVAVNSFTKYYVTAKNLLRSEASEEAVENGKVEATPEMFDNLVSRETVLNFCTTTKELVSNWRGEKQARAEGDRDNGSLRQEVQGDDFNDGETSVNNGLSSLENCFLK